MRSEKPAAAPLPALSGPGATRSRRPSRWDRRSGTPGRRVVEVPRGRKADGDRDGRVASASSPFGGVPAGSPPPSRASRPGLNPLVVDARDLVGHEGRAGAGGYWDVVASPASD